MDKSNKIKDSFEQVSIDDSLPNLWDNISKELARTATTSESTKKIKDSFASIQHNEAVELFWDSIESRLEVDKAWSGINNSLEKHSKFKRFRKRTIQLSMALLVLLWLRTCTPEYNYPTNFILSDQTKSTITKNTPQEQSSSSPRQSTLPHSQLELPKTLLAEEVPIIKKRATISEISLGKRQKIASKNSASSEQELINRQEILLKTPISEHPNFSHKTELSTARTSVAIAENNQDNPILSAASETNNSNVSIKQLPDSKLILQTNSINPLNRSSLALNNKDAFVQIQLADAKQELKINHIDKLDSLILATRAVKIKRMSGKSHLEFGLIGKLGSSILMGTTTSKALELTSMVKTKILPAGGIGMSLSYFLDRNNSFYTQLFPFVSTRQYFGGYSSDGRFYDKEIKMNYIELFVGYQRTLIHYNLWNQNASLYVRADYSLGYLSKTEEQINQRSTQSINKYQAIDHRLGLSVGTRYQIKHIVIDYGINGYLSLEPSLRAQANFSTSNTLIFGAYLGVSYLL